jgi:hypothetical protein
MRRSKKLSDLLFDKPAKVYKPKPIGHLLAINCYDKEEFLEILFIDNIEVVKSHTIFIFNKDYFETLPFSVDYTITHQCGAKVYYTNGANIDIIRIA